MKPPFVADDLDARETELGRPQHEIGLPSDARRVFRPASKAGGGTRGRPIVPLCLESAEQSEQQQSGGSRSRRPMDQYSGDVC